MDFFRSILSDDPEPEEGSETNPPSPNHQEIERVDDYNPNSDSSEDNVENGSLWSFGGLMKTLTTGSESVLVTYRRDIQEFGTGLRKETDLFREAVSRAVKELPASIEVGASAIDGVLKSTAEMIAQGKETLLANSDIESDTSEMINYSDVSSHWRRYCRYDSQLNSIQSDMRTYCEEPEDLDDYSKWKLGFVLEDKKEEIGDLVGDNVTFEGVYKKIFPNEVDEETFWCRYFYRVHKLKQQEEMRAKLVKRSLSVEDEEELSWDVDDDDEEEAKEASKPNTSVNQDLSQIRKQMSSNDSGDKDFPQTGKPEGSIEESKIESSGVVDESGEKKADVDTVAKGNVVESSGKNVSPEKVESVPKSDGKVEIEESCKDSDVSVVSIQPSSQEEEDLGWDEIEDLGSDD